MPFISVVIPIYNAEKYLHQCIDSVLSQTFSDIEVICVDDCSKDGSVSIVERYAKKDNRIRLLRLEKNMGTLKARSVGVEAATGQYIMFLDQDDEFEANACEVMRSTAEKHKADIYSFDTAIVCADVKAQERIQNVFDTGLYRGYIYDGINIMRKYAIEREIATGNVWNKMFASGPCKKAHEHIGDCQVGFKRPPIGEDTLAFIATAYYSESFFGVGKILYRRNYGRGFSNEKQLSLEDFERAAMTAISFKNCREFFAKQGEINKYKEVIDALGAMYLRYCTNSFHRRVSEYDKEKAIQLMMKHWPHDELAMQLGLSGYYAHKALASMEKKIWEVPFKLLPKGCRIVLYGAGAVGKDYYRQLMDSGYCDITLWVDRDYEAISKSGMPVSSPDEIANAKFDYLLIAVLCERVASWIKQYLIESLNISGEHIISNRTLLGQMKTCANSENSIASHELRIQAYEKYIKGVLNTGKKSDEFVDYKEHRITFLDNDVKPIAFYLPQFYTFPENDEWWGKGFTEWTNVTKAVPQYVGHYQPRLPYDSTFYDQSNIDTIRRQTELAKNYGIYGFCFHYYWFDGKRLLEEPLDLLLNSDIDFPFCLSWANENWTRRWDSFDDEVLIAQNHSDEDDLACIEEICKYVRDERYIRVNGKPLIIIYRPQNLPDANKTIRIWKEYCLEAGIGEICLAATNTSGVNPKNFNFDEAIAFPPNDIKTSMDNTIIPINPDYYGIVYDIDAYINRKGYYHDYAPYLGAFPGWDNTARRGAASRSFNMTPALYRKWLLDIMRHTKENREPGNRFVFINAWNEWAEGAHLEPCRKYGYASLQITADVVMELQAYMP